MKKKILSAAIAAFALVACNKETEMEIIPFAPVTDGAEVVINFVEAGGQFDTRAFFDNVADAEPWEKKINTATIYVFNPEGDLVMRKSLAPDEVTGLQAKVILPTNLAGKECAFYVVANKDVGQWKKESDFDNYYEASHHYNSLFFADVVSKSINNDGFVMTGSRKAVIQPKGTKTEVSFVLKRTIAKVAVNIAVDPAFAAEYGGGTIFIDKVRVSNSFSAQKLFPVSYVYKYITTTSFEQKPGVLADESYGALFYICEMSDVSDAEKVVVKVSGRFDQDGTNTTKDDQFPVTWEVKLNGSGDGEIKRNAYYRLALTIKSMNAIDDIEATLVAADWEIPSTQNDDLNENNQIN